LFLNLQLLKEDKIVLENQKIPYQIIDNTIIFTLEEIEHRIDLTKKVFQRENDEFCFILDLENEKSTYQLKTHDVTFDVNVDFATLDQNEQTLEINYNIETDDQKTKILIDFIK